MDLKLKDKYFIVGGAGDGFGKAITLALANEGAKVLAVSRTREKLERLKHSFPDHIEFISGDISTDAIQEKIIEKAKENSFSGIVVNAGGPPAGGYTEISMRQWDEAWQQVVRWKIKLINQLIPVLIDNQYGRIVCIESVSVKQPVENLILSNAMRPAVVGYAKSVAAEVASKGVTINVLAPGFHETGAIARLFAKKSELKHISVGEARLEFESEIPVGEMGKPEEFASIALWFLSPLSRYVTGQTITHDGGSVKGIFG
jgi:3-oxoacyl-[acyl-carrier protein] reductase